MTVILPDRGRDAAREPGRTAGLRLRLWLACLGGSMVAAAGIWWVIGTQTGPAPRLDLPAMVSWLGIVAGVALIVGAGFALWLDRGIIAHARGLTEAVARRRITALRGLPGTAGWGELSQLTQQIQQLVTRYRGAEQSAADLALVRDHLDLLREALRRWAESEQWKQLPPTGPAAPVIEALNRGLGRLDEIAEQNLDAARQIATELEQAVQAARDAAEQAERAFVEATALLTTVRELHRLGQELGSALPASGSVSPRLQPDAAASAREAIEELVTGSTHTVELLARGMAKVEEIAEQVPLIANRATLIALSSSLPGRTSSDAELTQESRQLALDIRAAVEHTIRLRGELEGELVAAAREMGAVRERVAAKLEASGLAPAPPAPAPARSTEDAGRLLERVREMIQDATQKGERLSATGERASRSAEALLRALEAETREMGGLLARLAPAGQPPSPPADPEATARNLRLLSQDDLLAEEGERRPPETGSAEEPR
jgi:methyl-accepting chemotaxis protein